MYLINIHVYLPYKREYDYRVKASCFSVAVSRGARLFRSEPEIKGKKFKEMFVKATKI
jgi:hypothetical protein